MSVQGGPERTADDVGGHLAAPAPPRSVPGQRATTSTVVVAPGRLLAGAGAVLVVHVRSAGSVPTGSVVAALEGGRELVRGELDRAGRGLLTVVLPLGEHTVRVCYDGDAHHAPSAAPPRVLKVLTHPTRVTLEAGDTVVTGDPVLLTARVHSDDDAPPPSGTVVFLDGPRELGAAAVDEGGHAVLPRAVLEAGLHRIVAAYTGDSSHAAARSTPMPQAVVVRATPTALLLEDLGDTAPGTVRLHLVELGTQRPLGRATGSLVVRRPGALEPEAVPLVDGVATLRLPGRARPERPAGTLRASYAGDAEHAPCEAVLPVSIPGPSAVADGAADAAGVAG